VTCRRSSCSASSDANFTAICFRDSASSSHSADARSCRSGSKNSLQRQEPLFTTRTKKKGKDPPPPPPHPKKKPTHRDYLLLDCQDTPVLSRDGARQPGAGARGVYNARRSAWYSDRGLDSVRTKLFRQYPLRRAKTSSLAHRLDHSSLLTAATLAAGGTRAQPRRYRAAQRPSGGDHLDATIGRIADASAQLSCCARAALPHGNTRPARGRDQMRTAALPCSRSRVMRSRALLERSVDRARFWRERIERAGPYACWRNCCSASARIARILSTVRR